MGTQKRSWILCSEDHKWLPQTDLQETGALHTETDATSANFFLGNKGPTSRSWSPDEVPQIQHQCWRSFSITPPAFYFLQQMCRPALTRSTFGCMLSLHFQKEDTSCPEFSSHLLFMPNSSMNLMVNTCCSVWFLYRGYSLIKVKWWSTTIKYPSWKLWAIFEVRWPG